MKLNDAFPFTREQTRALRHLSKQRCSIEEIAEGTGRSAAACLVELRKLRIGHGTNRRPKPHQDEPLRQLATDEEIEQLMAQEGRQRTEASTTPGTDYPRRMSMPPTHLEGASPLGQIAAKG